MFDPPGVRFPLNAFMIAVHLFMVPTQETWRRSWSMKVENIPPISNYIVLRSLKHNHEFRTTDYT